MVSEGVGGNCCYFMCFRRFSEGLKRAGARGRRRRSKMELFFLILKDFERKWRLGRKKRGGGGGRVADGAFWGVDFGSENTQFSHIYM